MKVLTWNLFHGRAVPPAGRELKAQFAATLADWDWDVALLQEVPPWWPRALALACDAQERSALTARNSLPALRRAIAVRRPDIIKSNGGGANTILVRGDRVVEHREVLLRRWPERRVCHAVRVAGGAWFANLHAQVASEQRARADIARAAEAALSWAAGSPLLLGGDFNVRSPAPAGLKALGGYGVDHVFGHGTGPVTDVQVLERGQLSDHAPVVVTVLPSLRPVSGWTPAPNQ